MRTRLLIAVGLMVAFVAAAFGSFDDGTHAGSKGAHGLPQGGPQAQILMSSQAALPAEAEAQSRIQPQALTERDRLLGVARIALVGPLGIAIPVPPPRRSRAASRAALSPARSPPLFQLG